MFPLTVSRFARLVGIDGMERYTPKRRTLPTTLLDIRREEDRRDKRVPERTAQDRGSESSMLRDARNVSAARKRQLSLPKKPSSLYEFDYNLDRP
jgi:hypothetical protein